ncbi:hypothetical protein UVI_02038640 [Ustilaginoidea virens]|uniref:Uncharacterized protein n=1 Tax=Ustilaginoidea virens TaxID=1159556 RepID=A0A1B5L1N2_USTVR|nr:hypothetical protein UVI_02038640 [Ustilaginoidea virens]
MSAHAAAGLREAKPARSLRKKLFYEFAVFILGSGNPLLLMLLWPGWLVVAALSFALWTWCL